MKIGYNKGQSTIIFPNDKIRLNVESKSHTMRKDSRTIFAGAIMFIGIINSGYAENDEIKL